MRLVCLFFCLFLTAVPCSAEEKSRYGLTELGISIAHNDLSGPTTNAMNSDFFAFRPASIHLHAKFGIELDNDISAPPVGLQFSSDNGLSFDIGTPQFWMLSAFADLGAAERPALQLERPGFALTTGLRGQYSLDLYKFGGEIGYASPLNFYAENTAYLGKGYHRVGFIYKIWAEAALPITAKMELSAKTEAAFGDQHYNALYFGVTQAQANQANQANFTAYEPSAGLIYNKAQVRMRYLLDNDWQLQVRAELVRFSNAAEDSPIIKEHGQWASNIALTAIYRF